MKIIKIASYAILVTALTFISCKKKTTDDTVASTTTTEIDETGYFAQHSEDLKISEINDDMGMDDAESALSPSSLGNKPAGTNDYPTICGIVDTSAITSAKTITITYNASCDGIRSRTGSIVIKLVHGTKWKDQGAVISLTYNNFQVTNLSTGLSNTLNGTQYVTNVSGGIISRIGLQSNPQTIVRRVRAFNLSITFDDTTVRTWSLARLRIWNGNAGVISSLTVAGDTTLNGVTSTEVWGTNRTGMVFTSVANIPAKVIASCGLFVPVSGKKTFNINGRIATLTLGTDVSGNVSLSGCPAYYLLTWTSLDNIAHSYIGTY